MKRLLKILGSLLVLILIAFTVFFFWASSSTMNSKDYEKLDVNNFESITNNDSIYSIVTYNVGYLSGMTNNLPIAKPKKLFEKNLAKVTEEIKKVNPDIIAFQEIDYNASRSYKVNQEKEMAKLGYNYVASGVNWDKRYVPFPYWPPSMHFGKTVSGQSIISKYPLKDYKRIVLERVEDSPFYRDAIYLDRLAQVLKVVIEEKEVVIINIHLEAFDEPTRKKQFRFVIDKLFNKYMDEYPTILLGDFNSRARQKNSAVQELFKMDGIGNAAFSSENPINTFDTKKPFKRIDYIFYTKKTIECVKGGVLEGFEQASDHFPVLMEFRLK